MKILIIRLDHIGDLVLTTPLIRAVAKAGHKVDVLIAGSLKPILEGNPYVREAFGIEDIAPGFPKQWRRLGQWIRGRQYDGILLANARPGELLYSSLYSLVRKRLALYAGWRGWVTLHRCLKTRRPMMQGRHFSDIQLDLARALQIPTDGLRTDYFCRDEETRAAQQRIRDVFPGYAGEPVIGVHPGCAGNTCNLLPKVYGDVAAMILQRSNARVVVTGSTAERALLESWPREVLVSPRVHVGMGEFDLRGLTALIAQFSNYVIVGTGPLHLASAVGVRTTSPFCAVPPLSFANWGNMNGKGGCVDPEPERCRAWIASEAEPYPRCHFRGEITAGHFWPQLRETPGLEFTASTAS